MNRVELKITLKILKREWYWITAFFLSLACLSFICNNFIGMVFLFIAFINLRYTYKDKITFHFDKTSQCIPATCLLFAMCTIPLIVFNAHISIIASVPIAVCATYYLYEKQCGINARKEVMKLKAPKPFSLNLCSRNELIERCRARNLSSLNTQRAIKLFIDKMSIEEVAFSESVEIDSIYKAKQRIKDKLS